MDSGQPLLEHTDHNFEEQYVQSKWPFFKRRPEAGCKNDYVQHQMLPVLLYGVLLGLAMGLSFSYWLETSTRNNPSAQHSKHQADWSPVLRDVEITYHQQTFNGSFLKQSIYRRDASPEVDAAWDALGVNYDGSLISKEDAARYGIPADWVHTTPEQGEQYVVNVEAIHQLHCLNLLRQSLYFNIDYYRKIGTGSFANRPAALKVHVTHCLDALRQRLMCDANTDVAGWRWYRSTPEGTPKLFPDFNTKHKCRNFEDIREWAEKRQISKSAESTKFQAPDPGDRVHLGIP